MGMPVIFRKEKLPELKKGKSRRKLLASFKDFFSKVNLNLFCHKLLLTMIYFYC